MTVAKRAWDQVRIVGKIFVNADVNSRRTMRSPDEAHKVSRCNLIMSSHGASFLNGSVDATLWPRPHGAFANPMCLVMREL
ncbi:MAG: hypothetical protein ACJAVT_002755 [Yoonia sp.]|jgi:hypothetical protein